MSLRHIHHVMKTVRSTPCEEGQQWLDSLPDEMPFEEAYNACPNFAWLDWLFGELCAWDFTEEEEEYIHQLYTAAWNRHAPTATIHPPLGVLPQVDDEFNNAFRARFPYSRFVEATKEGI